MKNIFKFLPLALCSFIAIESSAALAAPTCPPANDYIQSYNLPANLPMHTVFNVKYRGDLSEKLKIKSNSGWLLTITNIYPDLNTPVKTIGDIIMAMNAAENDAVTNLQDSQNKVAVASETRVKWEGKRTNVWECEYSIKDHPELSAHAILPRE